MALLSRKLLSNDAAANPFPYSFETLNVGSSVNDGFNDGWIIWDDPALKFFENNPTQTITASSAHSSLGSYSWKVTKDSGLYAWGPVTGTDVDLSSYTTAYVDYYLVSGYAAFFTIWDNTFGSYYVDAYGTTSSAWNTLTLDLTALSGSRDSAAIVLQSYFSPEPSFECYFDNLRFS